MAIVQIGSHASEGKTAYAVGWRPRVARKASAGQKQRPLVAGNVTDPHGETPPSLVGLP